MGNDAKRTGVIDRLYEFVENTRESADKVEDQGDSGEILNEDHGNGVATGLRWAAGELESLLDERAEDAGMEDDQDVEDGTDRSEKATDAVLSNLNGRKGFDHWWGDIDADIQDEIRESLADEIHSVYTDTDHEKQSKNE